MVNDIPNHHRGVKVFFQIDPAAKVRRIFRKLLIRGQTAAMTLFCALTEDRRTEVLPESKERKIGRTRSFNT